jgi:peptidoglycan/LPS O-acetylase OafA/YrhL
VPEAEARAGTWRVSAYDLRCMTGGVGATAESRPTLGYQPALDGVRAVAVIVVLGFHLGLSWLSGGYLGVSLFFTLSGFLITSLLLVERERHGRIRFAPFYVRRMRRLVPASLITVAAVAVLAGVGVFEQSDALRRGLLGAVLQVANWTELLGGRTYAELFTDPTPVAHFWSLSIEEQFYWLWPLAIAGLAAIGLRFTESRRLGWMVGALTATWAVTAVSAPLTASYWSASAAYFATWARSSEILAGAVLAAVVATGWGAPRRWWAVLAAIALVVVLGLSVVTPDGRGWPYEGGLPLFGLVSAALIAGLQVAGPVRTVLGWAPLVWIGRRSYGIYLYHWPIFLILDTQRTGLDGVPLHVARVGVTFVVAALSFTYFEQPIRTERLLPTARASFTALGASTAAVAVLVVTLVSPPIASTGPFVLPAATSPTDQAPPPITPPPPITSAPPIAAPEGTSPDTVSPAEQETPAPPPPDPVEESPVVIAVFGDSVPAWLLRDAAEGYSDQRATIVNGALEACDAFIGLPVGRDRRGTELVPPDTCVEWDVWYPEVIERGGGDVALLMLGQAPVVDRQIDGEWVHPCDTIEWYTDDLAARVDSLRSEGLQVVFALPARPGSRATFVLPDDQVERMECVRRDLAVFVEQQALAWFDLDPLFCPADDCDAVRSRDGAHVDPPLAAGMLEQIVQAALQAVATPDTGQPPVGTPDQ